LVHDPAGLAVCQRDSEGYPFGVRDLSTFELTLRIGVAVLAALLLGLEREVRGHPAGLRTHALVAAGAALFTISGAYGFSDVPHGPNVDPARIAAQVASGIGFLGAGAILRQGLGVRGLTTATTLWLAAAIGVASGAGAYPAVGVVTGVVLAVLVAMRLAKPLIARWGGAVTTIELDYQRGYGTLGPIMRTINGLGTKMDQLEMDDEDEEAEDGLRHVTLRLNTRDLDQIYTAVDELRERPEVRAVRVLGPGSRAA
jgi:putative Mg2+ transporter-C (MgtC) family protein